MCWRCYLVAQSWKTNASTDVQIGKSAFFFIAHHWGKCVLLCIKLDQKKKKESYVCVVCWGGGWQPKVQGPYGLESHVSASSLVPSLKRFDLARGSVEALGGSGRPHGHLGHFQVKRRPRVGPPVNAPSPHRTSFRPHPQIPSIQICLAAVIEPPAACQRGWSKREVS